jgi:hypothetical protein
MHLWTRLSLGLLLTIAVATAGGLALHHRHKPAPPKPQLSAEEQHGPPDCMQVPEEKPPEAPPEAPPEEVRESPPKELRESQPKKLPKELFVSFGQVEHSELPAAYLEQVTAEQTQALGELVEHWLRGDNHIPVSYRRGLVYVESAEDRGDDGPYPRSAEPEAIHACGSQALWLRSYMKQQLSYLDHLSCSQNVCSYDGMEYAPIGDLIFHLRPDGEWELRGWVLNYQAALGEAEQQANSASVHGGLMRLRNKSCAGEPDGSYP